MKVHKGYYILFGFKNTMMALFTGIIVGFLLMWILNLIVMHTFVIYENVPIIIRIFMGLAMPLTILSFFFVTQFIIGSFFWGKRRGAFEYSFLRKMTERDEQHSELGSRLKKINTDLKNYGDSEAKSTFKELMKMHRDNPVVNFQYAVLCENNGQGKEAVDAYERALKSVPETEQALKTYVSDQMNRVKTNGPSKCDVLPGSKYILY